MTDSYTPQEAPYTEANWQEFIQRMNSGVVCWIDVGIFDYFLCVLPPVSVGQNVTLFSGEQKASAFCFAEGGTPVAFWKENDRYFCQKTKPTQRQIKYAI